MTYVTHAVSADPINQIDAVEGLFISESSEFMAKYGITHVLSLTEDRDWPAIALESGFKQLTVPLMDTQLEDLLMYLDMLVLWIEDALLSERPTQDGEQGRKQQQQQQQQLNPRPQPRVLVHCLQGVSRSGAVVVAYTMRALGLDYDAALDVVRRNRPAVSPNPGFADQLRLWHRLQYRIFSPVDNTADPNLVAAKPEYESWRSGRGILMSRSEEERREANFGWAKSIVGALEYRRRSSATA
ncbi:protein-tyrosine phosphatase-like protein [Apiospora marii]|uniref:protein-tyrosine phosphatase-like protein n=1 Tax=Apiospora marii TaxID=335849 RepID=UPI00312D4BCD